MQINQNYQTLLLLRPLLPNMEGNTTGMPIIKRPKLLDYKNKKIRLTNFKNLRSIRHREQTIIDLFNFDNELKPFWNDPLRYVSKFQGCLAVASPDYSAYLNMNEYELEHNVFMSRWTGSLWQSMGLNVIPTLSWAGPETYDVCFSGIEANSIVIISTIGTAKSKDVFMLGFKEMKLRINPELIIVLGELYPEMTGNFLTYSLEDSFSQNVKYEQLHLFEMNNYLSREEEKEKYGW